MPWHDPEPRDDAGPRSPYPGARSWSRARRSPELEQGVQGMAARFRAALVDSLSGRSDPPDEASVRALEALFVTCLSSIEQTHRRTAEVNAALHRFNDILEAQIRRFAHSLHDEAGQILTSVYMALDELAADQPPPMVSRLAEIRALLDRVQEQIRRLSHELRPTILDDLGLLPALRFLCDGVTSRSGLEIDLAGSTHGPLPSDVETALYRISQEALTNVVKHSRGSHVEIHLDRSHDEVRCSIRDDGVGLDKKAVRRRRGEAGLGLTGIRVRLSAVGGNLRIHSAPGHGTELLVTIPLVELEEGADADPAR